MGDEFKGSGRYHDGVRAEWSFYIQGVSCRESEGL